MTVKKPIEADTGEPIPLYWQYFSREKAAKQKAEKTCFLETICRCNLLIRLGKKIITAKDNLK